MWPNTSFRGRGRGDLYTSQAPDQYPASHYVQSTAGSRRGGQPFNYQHQNRGKCGRARPLQNQNYFHNCGVNSNQPLHPSLRGGSRVLPPSEGVGLIDSAAPPSFASPRPFGPQFNEPRNFRYYIKPQDQRSDSVMSHVSTRSARVGQRARRDMDEGVPWPGKYLCPKCDNSYQFQYYNNKYGGKLPLVLHCGHTMCQECIYQGLKNNKINCVKCHIDSSLTQEQTPVCQADLYSVFRPNYHIFGVISFHRGGEGGLRHLDSIGFVTQPSKKVSQTVNLAESCCFSSCTKPATMYCPSCDGIYCSDCSVVVHKSAKNLMSHQPVPKRISKFTLTLENCNQHPSMPVEFFCKTCDLAACCYCVLNQHSDHERAGLYQLNQTEMEEFSTLQKHVQPILKHVLTAQKKASKLASFDPAPLKKQVCNYFGYYHGQLQTVESLLLEELDQFKTSYRGLDSIQNSLKSSAEELKQLVALDLDRIGDKKLNLRAALEKLRKLHEIPRFLLNDAGQSYPIRFVPDESILTNLPHRISLEKNEGTNYRLVREKELPEGYVKEDESDEEVDKSINAILNQPELQLASSSNSTTKTSRKSKSRHVPHRAPPKKPDMVGVELQHINSMDSFYVHLKTNSAKLEQLSKEIENYVKMGGAEPVAEPELNGMYLVKYIIKKHNTNEQMWCRARLHNIQSQGEETLYDVFFIDYGKTQFVKQNRIRDIPPSLCQKKPFALECSLHNPMNVNWNDKAHHSLARILNGKDVFMLEKSYNQGVYEIDLMIASSDGGLTSVIDILVHAYQVVDPINDTDSLTSATSKQINYGSRLIVFPNGTCRRLVKNHKEKVVIANIVDPHNIFVHVVQYQEAFKTLCHAIKKAFKNSKDRACIPVEGTYALVEYKDPVRSNFHRAFIKTVDIVSDKVHVLLVDWGLNVVVSTNDVRPMQESFAKIESQAVLVKLAHIAPYGQKSVWSRVSSDFLQLFFKNRDVLKMMVHDTEREIEVALFDCSKNVDVCINALMVENNYADSTGPISTKLNWPQYESNMPEFNEEGGLMSALLKKVIENSKDESDDEDIDDTDVKKRRIDVIKVESPSLVWIKFFDLRDKEREMNNGLQAHYSTETKTKSEWKVGDLCVVELDEKYCRGTVQEVLDGNCKIFLIDKIVEKTVPFDKIFEYTPYFTQFPQIAFKCHLANIKPAGDSGNWSISSIEALQELCSKNNRLYAGIINEHSDSKKKNMPIYMWYGLVIRGGALDPDRIKYISINNSLAKLGFAYKVPAPKIKKASTGEELLNSLIKKDDYIPSQEDVNSEQNETEVTKSEASSEKTPKAGESLTASDIDAIQNLSLEDQPVSDEKQSEKTLNWNEIIHHESETDGHYDKLEVELVLEDWLPPLRLFNTEFEARVTCIETGGHLYLHDKSVHQGYENMEKNMKEFFESEPPEWIDHEWKPGHLCTIKYTDGNWYRGKVLKVVSPQCITVFMIDFGSDHVLPATALYRELLYTNIPAFATKVMLDKVYARSGAWLTSDYDYFQSLVSDWCRVIVEGPKEVEVPLVEVYNAAGDNINKKLIELCPNLSRSAVFPVKESEDESDDFVVIEAIEPVELSLGNKVETTKYDILPLPQDLLEGKLVLMEIGGVFDFRKIAIRSLSTDENVVLNTMISEIQDLVSNFPPLTDFEVGTPCLAPFFEDDIYYRAKIIEVKSDSVHVLFVDYGNHESVPVGEVKTIPLHYVQLPQQCWEVCLNIEPANEDSDLTFVTEFVKHLEQRKKRIKLVKEDPITVDIYNKNNKLYYAQYVENGNIRILHQDM